MDRRGTLLLDYTRTGASPIIARPECVQSAVDTYACLLLPPNGAQPPFAAAFPR